MNTRNNESEKAAIQWLARLNSPEWSQEDEQAFTKWLNSSPTNQCAYIKAESLWHQASQAQQSTNSSLPRSWIQNPLFQAAAVSVFSLALLVLFSGTFIQSQPVERQSFKTAYAEQARHQLSDGSELLLNANTTTNIELDAETRSVTITQGEAFFNVKKDVSRPFKVITDNGIITVVGTQFSVVKQADDTEVTVLQGLVEVAGVTLTAGEKISVADALAGLRPTPVDASTELAWREKRLIYHGEKLTKVIEDLNRYFAEDIQLAEPTLANREVIAVIHLGDMKSTTSALAQTLNLKVLHKEASNKVLFESQ